MQRSAWAVVFALFLLSVLVSPTTRLAGFLALPWMRELGNMAYSCYLLHPIVLCLVFRIWCGADPRLDSFADLAPLGVAAVGALLASWLSWRFFERPILAMGRNFNY
jgi:peptidoglycan/LPS O-acetylase OafA/YrhL